MGAVHDIYGGFFSNKEVVLQFFKDRDLVSTFQAYFELEKQATQSHLFDIMAHPELIKKYAYQIYPPVAFELYREEVERLISKMVHSDVGIEINTKGIKLPVQGTYPSAEFLELYLSQCKACGKGPIITVGSDAHKIDDLGFGITEVFVWLRRLKVSNVPCFNQRQRIALSI
jgi:histidinol-phosphatase (PHP family)